MAVARRTRAEQFCHAAVNGIDSMWIATSEGAIDKISSHKLLAMGDRWLLEVLHVFDGVASNDMDKLAMGIPMLGLYAELYACADHLEGDKSSSNRFLSHMFELICEHRQAIFPEAITLSKSFEQSFRTAAALPQGLRGNPSLYSQLLLHGIADSRAGTSVTLFRDLLPALERLLDRDDALRNELRAKGLARRGMAVNVAKQLTKLARSNTQSGRKLHRRSLFTARRLSIFSEPSKLAERSRIFSTKRSSISEPSKLAERSRIISTKRSPTTSTGTAPPLSSV